MSPDANGTRTEVLDVRGLRFASEKNVVEAALGRRPGVLEVDANPTAQTATVTFDPVEATVGDLRGWVQECGYHCAGMSVPNHVCEPLPEIDAGHHHDTRHHAEHRDPAAMAAEPAAGHAGHDHHGGDGMSMAAMAADMRNRFLVAVVFALIITMYSHIGMEILGLDLPVPFGLRSDVW